MGMMLISNHTAHLLEYRTSSNNNITGGDYFFLAPNGGDYSREEIISRTAH